METLPFHFKACGQEWLFCANTWCKLTDHLLCFLCVVVQVRCTASPRTAGLICVRNQADQSSTICKLHEFQALVTEITIIFRPPQEQSSSAGGHLFEIWILFLILINKIMYLMVMNVNLWFYPCLNQATYHMKQRLNVISIHNLIANMYTICVFHRMFL